MNIENGQPKSVRPCRTPFVPNGCIGFSALLWFDFLETWLLLWSTDESSNRCTPSVKEGKGFCSHWPLPILTAVNADLWLSCTPGAEIVIGLGLIREVLQAGKGKDLPSELIAALHGSALPSPKRKSQSFPAWIVISTGG